MRGAIIVGLFSVAAVLSVSAGAGDDLWLAPDPPVLESGAVQLRLLVDGTATAFTSGQHVRFQRIWRHGRQRLKSANGTTVGFTVTGPGTQLLVYDDGVRFCKAFVVAGHPAEGGPLHLSEVGQRLEIVPQTDPVALLDGADVLEVQVLFEREPLAFATVEAVPLEVAERTAVRARTDEIGLANLTLTRVGPWLVRVRTGTDDDAVASTLFVMRKDGR